MSELKIGTIIPADTRAKKPKNYANNRDLLLEIHASKMSYCWTLDDDPKWQRPHAIIRGELIESKVDKNGKQLKKIFANGSIDQLNQTELYDLIGLEATFKDLSPFDVVVRVMTDDHMPADAPFLLSEYTNSNKMRSRAVFSPFKHYALGINGKMREVLRSNWVGDLETGYWSNTHGRMTDPLARMIMLMIDRDGQRPEYSGYSYLDEMKGNALMKLMEKGLMFDEHVSQNPFAYYTQIIRTNFANTLNKEKTIRETKNKLSGFVTHGMQADIDLRRSDH